MWWPGKAFVCHALDRKSTEEVRLDDKKRNRFWRKAGGTHEERPISAHRWRRRLAKGAKLSQDLARPEPYLENVGST
jgi:hypothetical protein